MASAVFIGRLAWVASLLLFPGLAAADTTGTLHGGVVARVANEGATVEIALPGAEVRLKDASGRVVATATTDFAGRFRSPPLPAGDYLACAAAVGFAETCAAKPVAVSDDNALRETLALAPKGPALHGSVTLADGSPAFRGALAAGQTAASAEVSASDGAGHLVGAPVPVNASGGYVLPGVAAADKLTVTARYEGSTAQRTLALTDAALAAGAPVDLVIAASAPVVTGVTLAQNGAPVSAAAPGSTVTLTLNLEGSTQGLHYRWTASGPGLVAGDEPTAKWTLPLGSSANIVYYEVTDGRGGATRGGFAIPAAAPQPARSTLAAPQRGPSPVAAARIVIPPLNICVLLGIYCPPTHSGPFIDPISRMNSACLDEATCVTEAKAYYKAIGALAADGVTPTATGTFKGWKQTFGFGASPLQPAAGEVVSRYYNNADLGFGRDMHCRENKTIFFLTVACYVSNYGDGSSLPAGFSPQPSIDNAIANTGRIATVAMVYSRSNLVIVGGNTTQDYRTQFYVFDGSLNNDSDDGALAEEAILDSQGKKTMPGICLACHGGSYDTVLHKAKRANFLPFDAPSFIFSQNKLAYIESSQREAMRTLNAMVKDTTYAAPTISQLIDGWYQWCGGVGASSCYIDDVGHPYYPNLSACPAGDQSGVSCGWPATWGGANAQSFYQHVPRVYCRTCHIAQAGFFNPQSFSDWQDSAASIRSATLAPQTDFMPLAEVPFKRFWDDHASQSALDAFLKATGP